MFFKNAVYFSYVGFTPVSFRHLPEAPNPVARLPWALSIGERHLQDSKARSIWRSLPQTALTMRKAQMIAEKLVEKAEWLQPPRRGVGGRQLTWPQLSPGQLGAAGFSRSLERGDSVNVQLKGSVSLFSTAGASLTHFSPPDMSPSH